MIDQAGQKKSGVVGYFVLFCIFSAGLTWPTVLHLSDRVLGGYKGDNFHFLWELWYVAHAVFDLHKTPLFDPDIYVPFGFDLIKNQDLSPGTVLLFMPFTRLIGEVATYNLLIMVSFALTGFGTFLLADDFWHSRGGAVLAGLAVAFCSYRFTHAAGHLSIVTTQWIPFFFLYLERTIRHPRAFHGVMMGVFYALCAWATWYYAWAVPIAAVFYLGFRVRWWSERRHLVALVKAGLIAVAVALLLILPFAIPYAKATSSGAMTPRSINEAQAFAASVTDFIIPPIQQPIWGPAAARLWRQGPNGLWLSEWQLYLGIPVIVLAGLGIFRASDRRLVTALLAVGFGCFVLSLGPSLYFVHPPASPGGLNLAPLSSIPMPVLILNRFPPFSFLRAWSRMGFFVQIAAALLAAAGLRHLLSWFPGKVLQALVVGFSCALVVLEALAIPYPMAEVKGRAVDRWLSEQPGKFPIMEYPISNHAYSGPAMYSTRLTGKQIVMGYASYPPNLEYWGVLSTFPSPKSLDLLEQWGTKYVLVDENMYRGGSEFWLLWQTWNSLQPAIHASGRLREVTVVDGVHVYELQKQLMVAEGAELLKNPGFEQSNGPTLTDWATTGRPIVDLSGRHAEEGKGACAVTPSDYLVSAPIPIEPDQCYILRLFAVKATSEPAAVRLQINWLDKDQKAIDGNAAGIYVVAVTPRWQSASEEFHPPAESRYAVVYATTQNGQAWIDGYSLRRAAQDCPASLVAIPNPALIAPGETRAITSISWNSHRGQGAKVKLSINGQPEIPFSEGSEGLSNYPSVELGSKYDFRLYSSTGESVLQAVTVTAQTMTALTISPLSAGPNPGTAKATIGWNTPGGHNGEILVSVDGGAEKLFVRGSSGAQEVNWLAEGKTYEFRLYEMSAERRLLGQLTVQPKLEKSQ